MICSLVFKDDSYECSEIEFVWDEFKENYKNILDPAILEDTRINKNRPPKYLKPNLLNDSAEGLLENFQLISGIQYVKDWNRCFLNEKQVCTVCLLNKQISILKRIK